MNETLRSEILGTAGLMVAAAVALYLTLSRRPTAASHSDRRRAVAIFVLLLAFQAMHAAEEYATGFHEQFPAALGLAPWPAAFFVTFNLTCLAVWAIAVVGLRSGYRPAFFPVWFLAIAGMANGIGHPLLAIRTGGYFPGLLTSPLVGVGGILLWRSLTTVTALDAGSGWTRVRGFLLFFETIVFTVVVPGAVMVWIPRDLLGIWGNVSPSSWTIWQFAALGPLTVGFAVYVRCVWEFAVRGRGIPAPLDHPKQLVVTGLYRYVRNPMYFGAMFFLLGQALFFESLPFLAYAVGWLGWVHLNVLFYEEPNLRRKFGESYERYKASVRRWIPGRPYREERPA